MRVATKKGGEHLGIHKGTKLTDAPKEKVIRARVDAETVKKLNELSAASGKSKSEIIRDGIDQLYCKMK